MSEAAEKIRKTLEVNVPAVVGKLTGFIKHMVEGAGARGVVLGLSGGLDSSVVAFLCARALGGDRVLCVCMPEAGVTSPQDLTDAREVADSLGAAFKLVDITPGLLETQASLPGFEVDALLPAANLKARMRMAILYYYANLENRLVVGCNNRSEIRAGYFTKYGDGAADLLPLGCLYKTQVKKLAAYLNVPKRIIKKVPSASLWHGQTDEGELGLPYEKLDAIYAGLDLRLDPNTIAEAAGVDKEKVEYFIERERLMIHKLKFPEIPEL